ncbi:Tetraspanin [Operophtera brumata]|uniref:Tetraspanin n=1 Tax=Operophtera brumata TaxID=104452 RepID=A0A0L7L616_OPEBR|nr:Tetraspanin [Operophtera brumata]
MIVLGISVYSHYHSFTFFFNSAKTGHFITPSVLCVFLGLVLLLVSLFGFFGSLKQSTCMAALIEVLVQNATVLGVLGVSVMFINLLGIIFALLLARCIRKNKSEKTLMMWKIKEQFIMAREAEESMKGDHVFIEQQASSTA